MELHFDQELTQAKDLLLRMSSLAEQAVVTALKGLVQRDDALAQSVLDGDLDGFIRAYLLQTAGEV